MTIGFHYHIPTVEKEDGYFYTSGAIGVFLDSMAEQCDELICFFHTALPSEMPQMDYRLKQDNITIVKIGPHDLFLKRIARGWKIETIIQPYLSSIDILLIRGPSPLLPLFSSVCAKHKVHLSYLLVGDYVKSFEGANVKGWKKVVLKKYYAYNKKMQDHYAKNALVFANSRVLYDEYKGLSSNVHEVKTTTLTKEDFFEKENVELHNPLELLYTGRIEPAKGLDEVLEAMLILHQEGITTVLNIVGWEDKKGYLTHLFAKAKGFELGESIVFHGKKQVGEELFKMYRSADIYIMASKGNEGFPRTIWEAMANSLPVIASKLGSIPHFLDDGENVLLVEPGNTNDIVEKIHWILEDEILRKKLVQNALIIVQNNTLENQAMTIKLICEKFIGNIQKI